MGDLAARTPWADQSPPSELSRPTRPGKLLPCSGALSLGLSSVSVMAISSCLTGVDRKLVKLRSASARGRRGHLALVRTMTEKGGV
jgi:hypothetical protein